MFVDTNVFAYALDDADVDRRDIARETVESYRRRIVVSQVLMELYAVCSRKLKMQRESAAGAVRAVALLPVVDADRELTLDVVTLAVDAQLSLFDVALCAFHSAVRVDPTS